MHDPHRSSDCADAPVEPDDLALVRRDVEDEVLLPERAEELLLRQEQSILGEAKKSVRDVAKHVVIRVQPVVAQIGLESR